MMKQLFLKGGKRSMAVLIVLLASTMMLWAQEMNEKFSMTTQMFLNELKEKTEQPATGPMHAPQRPTFDKVGLKKARRLIASPDTVGGVAYISCFIHLKDVNDLGDVQNLGVEVEETFDGLNFVTARVPVEKLEQLADIDNVTKIKVAQQMRPLTDVARQKTNVDDLLTLSNDATAVGVTTKYDGTGVVLGVMDLGIDFQHIAFKDKNGNSRIKRAYVYDGSTATEYTESNISSATTDSNDEDHGTHTASTAGGSSVIVSGSNVTVTDNHANATYGGMAPGADLYLAGINGLEDTYLTNALKKMVDYADAQGKPLVVSNSWGSGWGPHDGTGEWATLVGQYFGDSYPNRVILFAASNDAGHSKDNEGGGYFVKKSSASSSSPLGTIVRSASYSNTDAGYMYQGLIACAWSTAYPNCIIHVLNSSTGAVLNSWTVTQNNTTVFDGLSEYYNGSMEVSMGYDSYSEKYQLVVYSEDGLESKSYTTTTKNGSNYYKSKYTLAIEVYPSNNNSADINMWSGDYSYFTNHLSSSGHTWTAGTDDMCVSDEATIPNAISVGAYVSKTSQKNYQNTNYNYSSGTLGDIADFSSYATAAQSPTGLAYPWITAPGAQLVAGVNHNHTTSIDKYSYFHSDNKSSLVVNNSSNPYGVMQGTSMATPVAAGIVALWLQAAKSVNVDLTVNDVKNIMQETAIKDSYTTTGANASHFGKGKIDALAGIQYILGSTASPLIKVSTNEISLSGKYTTGLSKTATVNVKGFNLEDGITVTKTGDTNGIYTISPTSITKANAEASAGVDITITWTPQQIGETTATLTLSSTNATDVVITITGNATAPVPFITADESLSFSTGLSTPQTKTFTVLSEDLTEDITATLTDANGVFTLGQTTISRTASETKGVDVSVTFQSATAGTYTGTVTLSSAGADNVVISLTGTAATTSDEIIDFTQQGFSNQQTVTSVSGTNCTVTFDKGTNSTSPTYYDSGSAIRIYGGSSMTVSSADKTIVGIELTFGTGDGSNAITTDVESYSDGTWTGSSQSVTFTVSGTSGNRRIQKVKATYQEDTTPVDPVGPSNDFALVTSALDFTEGDYIVVYNDGAMNTTVSSNRLGYTAVTPTNDVITTTDASIIWHIAPSGNYYTIYNASENKYAAATGSNNQAQLLANGTDDKSLWSVTTGSTFDFVNKSNSRYLRRNGTYGFACYASGTGGALSLYKRTSSTTSSKQDVTMSFSPSSVEITQGDTFTAPTLTTDPTNLTVSYSSSNQSVATVNTSTGAVTIVGTGTTTITANFAGNDSYNEGSASYTLTVSESNAPGSQNNPYTVAQARAAIDAGTGITGVYATGIVSEIVTAYSSQYHNISYNISSDGLTTSDQLQSFRGKSYNGNNFTSADDIQVGDKVVIYGNLTKYNSIYEFAQNNQLVSLVRKQNVTMSFSPTSVTLTQGDVFTAPTLTTTPANLSVTYSSNNTDVASVNSNTGAVSIQGIGTATITATFAGNDEYKPGSASYTITVNKQDVTMSFTPATATATLGEDFTEPILTTTPANLTITYSSSAEGVATVNATTGKVTLIAAGTTTITATFAGNDSYNEGSASYTLTVSAASSGSETPLLYEGLSKYDSDSDGTNAIGRTYNYLDYSGWNTLTTIFAGGKNNAQSKGGCLKFGSNSAAGTMTTGNISLTGTGTLTFYLKKYGSDTGKLNVTVTGATADVTQFTPSDTWALCTVNLTDATGTVTISLATSSKRAYVDEITLIGGSGGGTTPANPYYQPADGKKGKALKTAMCGIIYNRTEKSYDYLWTAFQTTDVKSNGKIWDMYSNITDYTPVSSGSSYSTEGDCYNREHSWPQSWFNSAAPMYTDLHHIYPTDGFVNGKRSNYPFGETNGEDYKSANNFSKLGDCTYPGYTGTVFEPADEYKGDFARTYFYMVTCYEEKLSDWYNGNADGVRATIDGSTYPAFTTWTKNMLMEWAKNDPVSEKETARNNAVYSIQNNRNPFIDYPGLQEYIWGICINDEFSYDNYVQPVYKQNVAMSFSPTTATATVGVDFTEPTLTTTPANLDVTYSSSEETVATVDGSTGVVTLVAAGTTTITASFAGDASYNAGSASYTLTVSEASTPVIVGSDCFELVTDASTLAAGNTIVIAYVNGTTAKGMGTTQNNNNRSAVDVTIKTENTLTPSETTQIITLEKDGDNFLFNVGTGYLYAASSSSNYLRTETTADNNAKAAISITNSGDATITFQGSNTRNILRYNSNDNIFSCYASGQNAVRIYRRPTITLANGEDNSTTIGNYSGKTVDATLAGRTLFKDGDWNTLCLPFNMTEAQVTAQLAPGKGNLKELDIAGNYDHTTGIDGSTLYLNFKDATSITAGKPYIIKWEGDGTNNLVNPTFTGVTMGNSTTPGSVSSTDQSVTFQGTYGPVPLPKDDKTNLFVDANNTLSWPSTDNYSIKAFRAYFKLSEEVQAREFVLNFGDEETTTGIFENEELRMRNEELEDGIYDLQGRKIKSQISNLKPQIKKGLYIVNGRKVVIK